DLHRQALRLEPVTVARGARTERPVRLELLLVGPASLFEAAPQVRQQAFERILRPGGRPEQEQLARLARKLGERNGQVDAVRARQRLQRLLDELLVALRPGRNRAVGERLRFVRDHARRIEVDRRAEALARRARAMRRVERERARRHLRHAEPAVHARQPAREEAVRPLERVDDDDVLGEVEGRFERLEEPALDAAADDDAVHEDFDRVVAAPIELDVFLEGPERAVDADLGVAARPERRELLLELALAAAHERREDVDARVLRIQHHDVGDALHGLRRDLLPAAAAVRDADVGEEQPEIVVDFRDRADRGPRVGSGRLLLDRDGGRQAVDEVDVRLLHLLEELPRVRGQRLDVAALPFGVNRVEGERGLARARQAGDDHQLVAGDVDVDILEVMDAYAAYGYPVVRHVCVLPGEVLKH